MYVCMPSNPPNDKIRAVENIMIIVKWVFCSNFLEATIKQEYRVFAETIMQPHRAWKRKFQNSLWLLWPTQLPTQGQWWSIRITQALQILQWWARGGLNEVHFMQYRQKISPWDSSANYSHTESSISTHDFSSICIISYSDLCFPIYLNSVSLVHSSDWSIELDSSSTLWTWEKSYNFKRVNIFML